jgi:arylsulfatase A-like enzyme
MTGKYNFRNYIGFGLMAPDEITFGHIFSDAGYKTCISGKWQLYSYQFPEEDAEARGTGQKMEDAGFDEYCVWHAHHTEQKGSRYKDPVIYQNGSYLTDTDGKLGDDIFADYAIDFMERNKDEEFFIYFPMALTHRPFEPMPGDPEFDSFESEPNKTLGAASRLSDDWDDEPHHYKSMVEYHDKIIGRVNAKLHELGIADNTLVIYVGDNGSPQEVCSVVHDHTKICGGKSLTVDRGTHVPLICSWPGTIATGSVPKDLVDSSDFLPTILDAAGITPSDDYVMDGRSFLPQLKGEKGNPRDWMFFHFDQNAQGANNPRFQRFVRGHRWKLYEDGRLYDLETDPEEESAFKPSSDTEESASARSDLHSVFAQMVP